MENANKHRNSRIGNREVREDKTESANEHRNWTTRNREVRGLAADRLQGMAYMSLSQPGGEHGVNAWVLQQVLGKLGAAGWAVGVAMVDVFLEALQAKVVLARG
jgi:hypothetical protein